VLANESHIVERQRGQLLLHSSVSLQHPRQNKCPHGVFTGSTNMHWQMPQLRLEASASGLAGPTGAAVTCMGVKAAAEVDAPGSSVAGADGIFVIVSDVPGATEGALVGIDLVRPADVPDGLDAAVAGALVGMVWFSFACLRFKAPRYVPRAIRKILRTQKDGGVLCFSTSRSRLAASQPRPPQRCKIGFSRLQ
jgi:hypothetical protein